MTFDGLTIVTSCTGYGKYLGEWAESILAQTARPGRVCIFTHGSQKDYMQAETAMLRLVGAGVSCYHAHSAEALDLGVARNRAVELAETEWVVHLDADDTLLPHACAEFHRVGADADVVQAGYERVGMVAGMSTRRRVYTGADGRAALDLPALASGNSAFRRSLWEREPYRTDMRGAWDTALWIGFAKLGARFRPTPSPVFRYRQHADSVFNKRRTMLGWDRVHTNAMLKSLRRGYEGVEIIVPLDLKPSPERERNWRRVRRHYEQHHPNWRIVEGFCPSVAWVKGAAIQDAVSRSKAAVLVIADADCLVDPAALVESVCWVASGFAWSMPHRLVHRANQSVTEALCKAEGLEVPHRSSLDRPPYDGAPGGGVVVVSHVNFDAVGGIPVAFRGWGSEDKCLAMLLDRLVGPCERGAADLVHLWHPPQSTTKHAQQNVQLLQTLGYEAQKGRDALVQAVAALPRPAFGVAQAGKVFPIDHARLQERLARRRMR